MSAWAWATWMAFFFMVKVAKYSIHSVHLGIDWSHDNPQDSFWSVKGIQTSHSNPSWEFVKIYENLPSLANSKSTWNLMIGRRFFPFGFRPIFMGEVLVLRRVYFFKTSTGATSLDGFTNHFFSGWFPTISRWWKRVPTTASSVCC